MTTPASFDTNEDGVADQHLVDRSGDGLPDTLGIDQNQNGFAEEIRLDTDLDGREDTRIRDLDEDGRVDVILTDANRDGIAETAVPGSRVDPAPGVPHVGTTIGGGGTTGGYTTIGGGGSTGGYTTIGGVPASSGTGVVGGSDWAGDAPASGLSSPYAHDTGTTEVPYNTWRDTDGDSEPDRLDQNPTRAEPYPDAD